MKISLINLEIFSSGKKILRKNFWPEIFVEKKSKLFLRESFSLRDKNRPRVGKRDFFKLWRNFWIEKILSEKFQQDLEGKIFFFIYSSEKFFEKIWKIFLWIVKGKTPRSSVSLQDFKGY